MLSRLGRQPPIAPHRWRPPTSPPRARRSYGTHRLGPVRRIELPGHGPEDVTLDDAGRIYAGLADGRVIRVAPDGGAVQTLSSTGGRPLGLEWARDGRLLVCDAHRGLLGLDTDSGAIETIVRTVNGIPMKFCSNAAAASDGTIYFTDSTRRFGFDDNYAEILEHSCTGRLLRLAPGAREPEVLLDGLAFANGLTLAPDESFALIVETFEYRVARLWLTGQRVGQRDSLLDNLPGVPDNMSTGSDGLFWIAVSIPRNAALDALLALPGVVRQLIYQLPQALQPRPAQTLWVIAVDADGTIRYDLQADGGVFSLVTGVCERGGRVYLSSYEQPALATFELAELTPLSAPPA